MKLDTAPGMLEKNISMSLFDSASPEQIIKGKKIVSNILIIMMKPKISIHDIART